MVRRHWVEFGRCSSRELGQLCGADLRGMNFRKGSLAAGEQTELKVS